MSTSPVGTVDYHDWKRVGELLVQGLGSVFLTNVLALLPVMNWGKYESIEMILVMLLTEAGKRYLQAPQS